MRPRRALRTRHLVVAVICGCLVALGAGPVRAVLSDGEAGRPPAAGAKNEPTDQSRDEIRGPGIWDTTGAARSLPDVTRLSPEEAMRLRPDPTQYVVLTGTLTGEIGSRVLPGVGVLVTERDQERVATFGELPDEVQVLEQVSSRRLEKAGVDAVSGPRGDLGAVVTQEIAPRITSRSGLVAGRVVSDLEGPGLLEPKGNGLDLTTRGLAYAVTAHAVPPGSRVVRVTTEAAQLSVLAFAHGDTEGAVLIHNTGAGRRLVIDLLVEEAVHRYVLRVAPRSLTAMVLS